MKNLWHDPVDDRRKKGSRKRKKAEPKPPRPADDRPILPDPAVVEGVKIPGMLCSGCDFDVFDVTHRAPKVLVWGSKPVDSMRCECVWCGLGVWRRSDLSILPEPTGRDYRFRDGVFRGKTVALVLDMPGGADYIRWCAVNGKTPAAKEACLETLEEMKCEAARTT